MEMSYEELVKKVNENQAAAWLLFEIKNLEKTFEEPDDIEIKTEYKGLNHTMVDTIENLLDAFMQLIWVKVPVCEEWDHAYDNIQGLTIESMGNGIINYK